MFQRATRIVLITCTLGVTLGACGDDDPAEIRYTASLSGSAEVPPRTTTATGTATFVEEDGAIDYEVIVNGITAVTASHIHLGAAGSNGGVIVPLFGGPVTGALTGRLAAGTITQSSIVGLSGAAAISMDSLRTLMRNGNAYVNVHSTTYPGGELRGQIVRR